MSAEIVEDAALVPIRPRPLFDLPADLVALHDLMSETGGEFDDAGFALLDKWFAEIATEEGVKLDNYVGLIRMYEMQEAAAKEEMERWQLTARVRGNGHKRLKERLKLYLEMTRRKKVVTAAGRTLAIQNNGGILPLIVTENLDPASVPAEFQRVKVEIDNAAVRKALDAERVVGFAAYGPRGERLVIK